jgi:hypothetical protein
VVVAAPDREHQEERLEAQRHAQERLADKPELALIKKKDVSPEAWRSLQMEFAKARGDFETAERLFWEHYDPPDAPADEPEPFVWKSNWFAKLIVRTGNEVERALTCVRERIQRGTPRKKSGNK